MIKGVFFDLGGTLYRYGYPQSMLGDTVTRLVDRLGLEHDAAELAQLYAQANADVAKEFAQKPFFLVRDWFRTLFARFLERIEAAHLAHHVDMGVPFQNLPRLQRELQEAGWITLELEYPSYLALWSALSSRPQPASSSGPVSESVGARR